MTTTMRVFKKRNLKTINPTWEWIKGPTASYRGGLLINGTGYLVGAIRDEQDRIIGFRLAKADGEVYDLPIRGGTCTCADATFNHERPGGCKHRVALQQALPEFPWEEQP